ncbi:tRNA-splicing endonuclease subunit [Puccinia graminis f. sp. tritici]|uniref:tRNA-splicing endonuclease subunit Sen34 n=1 Tax=Puccinia graminis f. sp. tritici TaxID=56615 RepID=A0A5B0MT50_PUCGR|nr:tRNA-splicing endonuclease subunit [Puccinia graminis f. sp. tritici]KAA1094830.1 tRNA-splicing endonuclease subunit [Puccinia graminis f. sp. tritici]
MENDSEKPAVGPLRRKPPTSPIGPPIPIYVSNGEAYIWAVDQVERLRIDYQISGLLTGTLPQLAQQNVFLGLPLQLMPEEVVVLVELGIAVLVDDLKAHRPATVEESTEYQARRDQEIAEERRLTAIREGERRAAAQEVYRSQIAAAEQKRRARQPKPPSRTEDGDEGSEEIQQGMLVPDGLDEKSKPAISPVQVPYFVPIHLQSHPPTHTPEHPDVVHHHLDSARRAGLWTFPDNQLQRARSAVFSALWRQGMFLGIGLKFGCDFLVYPGDSLRFHSHFACTVIQDPDKPIAPLSLVSYGRLATAVKKSHLLACWDEHSHAVRFLSLEWAGMG